MKLMLNQNFDDSPSALSEIRGDISRVAFCSQVPSWLQIPAELTVYSSGEECRLALQEANDIAVVIVGEDVEDVAPLNLVGALVHDRPDLKVFILSTEDDETLRRHGILAGALAVIDEEQLRDAIGAGEFVPESQVAAVSQTPSAKQTAVEAPQAAAATQAAAAVQAAAPQSPPAAFAVAPQAAAAATQAAVAVQDMVTSQAAALGRNRAGLVFGFISASGGVGKSTLAVIMALLAQARGLRVALVDLDLQFGNIAYMVAQEEQQFVFYDINATNLDSCCLGEDSLRRFEGAGPQDISPVVVAKNSQGPEYAEALFEKVPQFLNYLRSVFDVVIVDTSAFWSDAQAQLLDIADTVYLVLDQRSLAIKTCQVAEDLCGRMGIPSGKVVHLLNRCSRRGVLSTMDVSFGLGCDAVVELPDGGRDVDELLGLGRPLALWESSNSLLTAVDALLTTAMEGRGVSAAPAKRPSPQKRGDEKPRTRAALARRSPHISRGEGVLDEHVFTGTRRDHF